MSAPIRLAIVGSARPAGVGPAVANWFAGGRVRRLPGVDPDLVDLAEVALPFLERQSIQRLDGTPTDLPVGVTGFGRDAN